MRVWNPNACYLAVNVIVGVGCLEEGGDSGDRGRSRDTPLLALAPHWVEEGDLLEGER